MVVKIWKTWLFRAVLLVLFAISLLLILFMANGYQYDFLSHQIRKTGIIDISYSDPQAKVYLEGHLLEGKLPFVASNVLPGVYNLVIGREGYYDYSLKVRVDEDLISRVGSVFLYPVDVLISSRLIFDWAENSNHPILVDGYIFRQNQDELSWAKLRGDLEDQEFLKANVLNDKIENIKVFGKEALLEFQDGRREILDMFNGEIEKVNLSDQYVFAGDRWFYFQDNLLTAFDRKLSRVIWVKTLDKNVKITAVEFTQLDNRDFLSLTLNDGGESGMLYELKGDSLQMLLAAQVSNLQSDVQGNLFYLKNDTEIWTWLSKAKNPQLLARFQAPIKLLSVDLNFYKTFGLILFQNNGKYFLADQNFGNVRELFPELSVEQLDIVDHNKIFYINNYQKNQQPMEQRLLVLDLEQ